MRFDTYDAFPLLLGDGLSGAKIKVLSIW